MEWILALKLPLLIVQAVTAPVLIIFILLQSGKEGDLGSALGGGGGGNTVLGTGGTSKFLVKGTVIFAIVFMINSIALAKIFKTESSSSFGTTVSEPLVPADVKLPTNLDADAPQEAPAAMDEAAPAQPEAAPANQ